MSAAAQSLKLGTGLREICGLVEPYLAADQELVGADDNSSTTATRNLACFRLGKSERAVGCIAPLCPAGLFEKTFVKLSRLDPEIDAGGGEQTAPARYWPKRGPNPQSFIP